MNERLKQLFDKYYRKDISAEEKEELFALMADPALEEELKTLILDSYSSGEKEVMPAAASDAVLKAILAVAEETPAMPGKIAARRIRPVVWIAAASVAVVLAAGLYLWQRTGSAPALAHKTAMPAATVSTGTMLTLADGRQISLDSLENGLIASDAGADIAIKDGQLLYDPAGKALAAGSRNTIGTPNGKQFRVVLSDGTQVWLNAASSLSYPVVFGDTERTVEITGEAYFEVASHAGAPFIVTVAGQAEIQVLGTQFNVNAYPDAASIKATLLQGAVRVKSAGTNASVVLAPGQQAKVTGASERITVEKVDTENVMAWRNGTFNFDGLRLNEVMNELARWYNIEVVYEKGVPDIRFFGALSRSLPLQDVIKALEESKVHVKMEGSRKLIVLP